MKFEINTKRTVTEFIVADSADAKSLVVDWVDSGEYRYFRCFNVDLLGLAELYSLSHGLLSLEDALELFSLQHRSADGSKIILSFPCDFVHKMTVKEWPQPIIIDRWKEQSGILLSSWHKNYRNDFLFSLKDLANQAVKTNQSILVSFGVR